MASIQDINALEERIYDRLYERLKKAFQRGTPVLLTVRG